MFNKMKQFTSIEQTAKLIELGFEKPKGWYTDGVTNNINLYVNITRYPMMFNYSVGELLSFLPQEIKVDKYEEPAYIQMLYDEEGLWEVGYTFYGNGMTIKRDTELIDCLFQMCVRLKEEKVI